MQGIIAPSPDADRAVRYLAKYLTKSIADTYADPDAANAGLRGAHRPAARRAALPALLAAAARTGCATASNPTSAGPGLRPGRCGSKAHDRENLGLGGRRVLVSRQWSGKTLAEHRADRATVVREALADGRHRRPRDRTDRRRRRSPPTGIRGSCGPTPDPTRSIYARVILASIAERQRWRAQYEAAKAARQPVDSLSATDRHPDRLTDHGRAGEPTTPRPPRSPASPWSQDRRSRVSAANPQDTKCP